MCLLSLVIKGEERIPELLQKCKAGSAVKDVEAAAFPWEAANLEVEYGLVSSGAAARAAQAVWWGHFPSTSYCSWTAEPLRIPQLKNFVQNHQTDLHPLHSEFIQVTE